MSLHASSHLASLQKSNCKLKQTPSTIIYQGLAQAPVRLICRCTADGTTDTTQTHHQNVEQREANPMVAPPLALVSSTICYICCSIGHRARASTGSPLLAADQAARRFCQLHRAAALPTWLSRVAEEPFSFRNSFRWLYWWRPHCDRSLGSSRWPVLCRPQGHPSHMQVKALNIDPSAALAAMDAGHISSLGRTLQICLKFALRGPLFLQHDLFLCCSSACDVRWRVPVPAQAEVQLKNVFSGFLLVWQGPTQWLGSRVTLDGWLQSASHAMMVF